MKISQFPIVQLPSSSHVYSFKFMKISQFPIVQLPSSSHVYSFKFMKISQFPIAQLPSSSHTPLSLRKITRRLALKKTVSLRGRVRWIWVWSTKVDMICFLSVGYGVLLTLRRRAITLETSAKHHIPQAKNISYEPLLIKPIFKKTRQFPIAQLPSSSQTPLVKKTSQFPIAQLPSSSHTLLSSRN